MKQIKLTQGFYALVDDEDYEQLSKHNWYTQQATNTQYAIRWNNGNPLRMHREILGLGRADYAPNTPVDHINKNGLDNRKCNLRITTQSQNLLNCNLSRNNKTGITGVSFCKRRQKFATTMQGKHLYWGEDFFEACCVRKAWENKLCVQF